MRLIDGDKIITDIALYLAEFASIDDIPMDALNAFYIVSEWIKKAPAAEVRRGRLKRIIDDQFVGHDADGNPEYRGCHQYVYDLKVRMVVPEKRFCACDERK